MCMLTFMIEKVLITSKVERVYMAVRRRWNGVYLLSPDAFIAAVSVCLTTPTCKPPYASFESMITHMSQIACMQ